MWGIVDYNETINSIEDIKTLKLLLISEKQLWNWFVKYTLIQLYSNFWPVLNISEYWLIFISFQIVNVQHIDDNNTTYIANNSCSSFTTYNATVCNTSVNEKIQTSEHREWNSSYGKRTRSKSRPILDRNRSANKCWIYDLYISCKYPFQLIDNNRSNVFSMPTIYTCALALCTRTF